MTKHEQREKLFQLIFELDFHEKQEKEEQMDLFRRLYMAQSPEDFELVKARCEKVLALLGEIDMVISEISTGWSIGRLGKAELAILRVAVYEILHDDEVPASVAINEAVELSKAYGSDNAHSFVNGVLAKLAK